MTKPRMILHIGSHKTGTSSLQKYLGGHPQALRESGVFYPASPMNLKTLRYAHHHVASALSDDPKRVWSEKELSDWLASVRDEAGAGETVLLSSEQL